MFFVFCFFGPEPIQDALLSMCRVSARSLSERTLLASARAMMCDSGDGLAKRPHRPVRWGIL